jgi:site-specific DNA recombinase
MLSYKIHKKVAVPKEEWIVVQDTHDAIIDRETFERVQKAILDRDTKMNSDGKISIFAGHIKCGDCQRAMSKRYQVNITENQEVIIITCVLHI